MELGEETGVQRSLRERLVRSWLQWAGHRKRGSPSLRWEDCVKRDARKLGEEEDWKKKTRDMGGWKRLSDETVKKLRASPHP